jgi:valyl-tRNA synthetase
MTELPKTFDPAAIEARWYRIGRRRACSAPSARRRAVHDRQSRRPTSPGSLHIGHALDNTLQDILIRHARMQGKDALWVVGMDHAGIATQMVVERKLESQGVKRTDMGREEFVEKVWEWKAKAAADHAPAAPPRRSMRLGERALHHGRGLQPRRPQGVRRALPRRAALPRQAPGQLGPQVPPPSPTSRSRRARCRASSGTCATRWRTAAASSRSRPRGPRRCSPTWRWRCIRRTSATRLVGKQVRLPITGRLIPIVADEHADPELGSGAVKITPGHDFNDFEVGKRAGFKAGRHAQHARCAGAGRADRRTA